MNYPRVLHLGFLPIGSPDNSGLTLGSLFGEWPEDHLLQLCTRSYGDTDATNVVLMPPSVAPVDGLVRAVLGRSLRPGPTDGLNQAISRRGRKVPLAYRLRLAASAMNDVGPVVLPRSLTAQVADFNPEVIHSLLGGVRPMRLAIALSKRFNIPIAPHFMDDWVDALFADGQLLGYARRAVERSLRGVLERSPLCLTIGDDMKEEYSQRLGRPCVAVGNSVALEAFQELVPRRPQETSPRVIRYVGGLHLGRADVVRSIAGVLDSESAERRNWVLELFVPESNAELARALSNEYASVWHGGSLPPSSVPQALVDADALLFLESSDPQIVRFTRLSVSTKVPQYLAAGRPVIVVGPAEQGSVRVLTQSGAGFSAGDGLDPLVVRLALERAEASDLMHAVRLAPERATWIHERFSEDVMRERLRRALLCASASSAKRAY